MSEAALHFSVVDALHRLKRPGVIFWHAANGEKRDFLEAMAERGHLTGVAYSFGSAVGMLAAWNAIRAISHPSTTTQESAHA
jgi:hypothetical protein